LGGKTPLGGRLLCFSTLLDQILACSVMGSAVTVTKVLEDFIARTSADELMITSRIFDYAARLRSFEFVAECL
jgi:hypothetical protein